MKPSDQGLGSNDAAGEAGFTLLEMIISLTILSLVVLTVYVAFSLGVDVWQGMEENRKTPAERKALALRLLHKDFSGLRPYTWNNEKGTSLFFAGGPQCVFYVTTNGLGATHRSGKALFFTCLYVHSTAQEEGRSLYVYKNGVPLPELLDALQDFRSGGEMQRTNYVPPAFIRQESIRVVNDLQDAQFGYQKQAYPVFSGAKTEVESERNQQRSEGDLLAQTQWVDNELPGQISFSAGQGTGDFIVRTVLSDSPALDHPKP